MHAPYVYISIRICVYICMCIFIYTYIYTNIYSVYICVCIYIYMYIYTHMYIYIHVCVYIYIYICIHTFKCIYIHTIVGGDQCSRAVFVGACYGAALGEGHVTEAWTQRVTDLPEIDRLARLLIAPRSKLWVRRRRRRRKRRRRRRRTRWASDALILWCFCSISAPLYNIYIYIYIYIYPYPCDQSTRAKGAMQYQKINSSYPLSSSSSSCSEDGKETCSCMMLGRMKDARCGARGSVEAKETYYRGKRDLLLYDAQSNEWRKMWRTGFCRGSWLFFLRLEYQ